MFVSGRPSLDFVGTSKWRRDENVEEQLIEPSRLSDWARGAGLVDEPTSVDAGGLAQAIELREALYRIVRTCLTGQKVEIADANLVNSYARRQPVIPELLLDGRVRRRASTRQLLASIAVDTLDLLAGTDKNRVRECSSPRCTRLYVDTSRTGNRRWCGMAECGNRAKAQTFRQRHHAATATTASR